jgi:hypothetical protein
MVAQLYPFTSPPTTRMATVEVFSICWPGVLAIDPRGGPNIKDRFQQFLYYCYGWLPNDSSDIVDVFIGRYQATHVSSRDRCIATVLHATILSTR